MRLLLDTHTYIWWLEGSSQLSDAARTAIEAETSEVLISVASAWEIAIKVGLGKLPTAADLLEQFEAAAAEEGFGLLQISVPHVRAAGLMQSPHRDPFDRLLAAQAQIEGLTLVTADGKVRELGATWFW